MGGLSLNIKKNTNRIEYDSETRGKKKEVDVQLNYLAALEEGGPERRRGQTGLPSTNKFG